MKKAFTLIELMIVIAIIAIIAAIAIPNLLEARKHGNEISAIGSLRTINASQAVYLERSAAQTYGVLPDLQGDGYVDSVLGGGFKQGYRFGISNVQKAVNGSPVPINGDYEYYAAAGPVVPGQTGDRYFQTSQSGVIEQGFGDPLTGSFTFTPIGGK
jgi:type IV pilus assembly protein PilA